ncbi:MAG: IS4 family transposase [Armatimonadetes bacterium]|nr:IS4 family transposase [Armatimonadota bacterium]
MDSTAAPSVCRTPWRGCGGRTGDGTQAALKLQVRLDLAAGALAGPELQPGRASDRSSGLQAASVPVGALRLTDLGCFSLAVWERLADEGSYWLTRLPAGTTLTDAQGQRGTLETLLRGQTGDTLEMAVTVGVAHPVAARLRAVRVAPEVAEARRRKLHQAARKKGQTVSQARLATADWTVFITNVPAPMLTLEEVLILARTRWQIELVFKLWKSLGQIDQWRSAKPWRILCEVYAKLLAMLIQHWVLVSTCWQDADRSWTKAAHAVRRHAICLALALADPLRLTEALGAIARSVQVACRINKRKAQPHTYQLLFGLPHGGLT